MLATRQSLGYGGIVAFLDRRLGGVRSALEVGTGYGVYALYLARRGIDVLAVNLEPNYIEVARTRAATLGLAHVRFEMGDVLTAPLRDGWDLVLASEVIEHLPDDVGMLRRLYAAVRPGGLLILTTPRATPPSTAGAAPSGDATPSTKRKDTSAATPASGWSGC